MDLEEARHQLGDALGDFFSGPGSPEFVGVDVVDVPRLGLIVRLRITDVLPVRILDIFIAAYAMGESDDATGLLERLDDDYGTVDDAVVLILFHFIER